MVCNPLLQSCVGSNALENQVTYQTSKALGVLDNPTKDKQALANALLTGASVANPLIGATLVRPPALISAASTYTPALNSILAGAADTAIQPLSSAATGLTNAANSVVSGAVSTVTKPADDAIKAALPWIVVAIIGVVLLTRR